MTSTLKLIAKKLNMEGMELFLRVSGFAIALVSLVLGAVPVISVGGVPASIMLYPDTRPVHVYVDALMRARYCYSLLLLASGALLVASMKWRSVDAVLLATLGHVIALVTLWRFVHSIPSTIEVVMNGWVVTLRAHQLLGMYLLDALMAYSLFHLSLLAFYVVVQAQTNHYV